MSVSQEFKLAIREKNKTKIRIMLKDSLLVDITFKQFDERISYAEKNISDLYDVHNGEEFLEENSWTVDYLNKQMVTLIRNFSQKRIKFLKRIINKLYKSENAKSRNSTRTSKNINDVPNNDSRINPKRIENEKDDDIVEGIKLVVEGFERIGNGIGKGIVDYYRKFK